MDYLIKLLGDYSIGWAITVIAALALVYTDGTLQADLRVHGTILRRKSAAVQ